MSASISTPFTIERVAWNDPRANAMHDALMAENAIRYADLLTDTNLDDPGVQEAFAIDPDSIVVTLIALDADGLAIGHAALRTLGEDLEIKRVIVLAQHRGRGIARAMMTELEAIARDAGVHRLILQTGDRQPEAVALYTGLGYTSIPVFAPYEAFPTFPCFEKVLA